MLPFQNQALWKTKLHSLLNPLSFGPLKVSSANSNDVSTPELPKAGGIRAQGFLNKTWSLILNERHRETLLTQSLVKCVQITQVGWRTSLRCSLLLFFLLPSSMTLSCLCASMSVRGQRLRALRDAAFVQGAVRSPDSVGKGNRQSICQFRQATTENRREAELVLKSPQSRCI